MGQKLRRSTVSEAVILKPIGLVKSKFSQNTPAEEMRAALSQIEVDPEFEPGLLGLEAGQDVLVLFYLHKIGADEIHLQLHPRHNPENPLAGVFATRSQFRPNQIATTVARIEQIDGNKLSLSRLDAQDGTPVIDIKPYAPFFDADIGTQRFEVRESESLQACRDAIDLIDIEIIRLLGNRAKYVQQVTKFKKSVEEVPAPERYRAVLQHRRDLAVQNGLNPDVIEEMYRLLIDNFILEEIEIIRRRESDVQSAVTDS
jgi:tRNA-Thr(GGU) m(6)t(6)A37 methyltransferase TsaA